MPFIDTLHIYVDGASKGNPGPASIGIVVRDKDGNTLDSYCECIGEATNNVAEYKAVIKALEIAARHSTHNLKIFSDSQLVVKQLNREFRITKPHILELHEQVRAKERTYKNVQYILIKREQNHTADKLASDALKRVFR